METKVIVTDSEGNVLEEQVSQTAPHSVELSCNAKGQYSWTVKVYFQEDRKKDIGEDIELIVNQLKAKFSNPPDEIEKIKELAGKAAAKKV